MTAHHHHCLGGSGGFTIWCHVEADMDVDALEDPYFDFKYFGPPCHLPCKENNE